jgi:protein-disulfide isomerase
MMETIRNMAKEGATAQIRGTPAVFVNNKLLEGGQLVPVLEGAYRSIKK